MFEDDDEIEPDEVCFCCGKNQTEAKLRLAGHGRGIPVCADMKTCDPHHGPRRRYYGELTDKVLDDLEYQADKEWPMWVEVDAAILHSLLRETRRAGELQAEVFRLTDQLNEIEADGFRRRSAEFVEKQEREALKAENEALRRQLKERV